MNDCPTELRVRDIMTTILGEIPEGDFMRSDVPTWDSLKHMQMVFALEDSFDCQFTEDQIPELDSLGKIVEALRKIDEA
jgi:acyl carrier protein